MEGINIYIVSNAYVYFVELAISIQNWIHQNLSLSCVITTQYDNDKTNIVFGAHSLHRITTMRDDTIVVNMEQLYHGLRWLTQDYIENMRQYKVWDYDLNNISWLKFNLNINASLFTISFPNDLNGIHQHVKDIDVL